MRALQQTDIKARDPRGDTREPDRVKMGEEKALSHKGRDKREGERDKQTDREGSRPREGEKETEKERVAEKEKEREEERAEDREG